MPAQGQGSGKSAQGEQAARRPASPPVRPSASTQQRQALAQERAYGSQGVAVKRAATQQRQASTRRVQLARSVPVAGDAPQRRQADLARAQTYVRSQYGKSEPVAKLSQGAPRYLGSAVVETRGGRFTFPVHYKPGTTVPPDIAFAIQSHDKRQAEQAKIQRRLAPGLTILAQTGRPYHAIAAGARAAIRGQNVLKGAERGAELKDTSSFKNVLNDLGVKGPVADIAGFGLDVGLDPTTYISFGTASIARHAAEDAARGATKKALAAGASKKAADKAGRAAAQKALAKETNKGLTVGALGKRTSGRTTAAVSRALHLPQAGEKARGSLAGRLVSHVAPGLRPAGVSQQSFDKVRAALTRSRSIASAGEHAARNKAQAIARVLGGGESHPKITDALESRSLASLTDKEKQVAQALAHDYGAMHATEHAAGLVGPKFKEFGYSPRRPLSELEPAGSKRGMSGAQLASSKARTNRKLYSAFRGTPEDVYTENAPLAYYLRGRDSAIKLGRKEVIDALHGEGKRWHPGLGLGNGEEIYKFAPNKMPVKVEGDELKSLMRGGAPPGLNEYRVLHKNLVGVAEQNIPERLGKLEEIGRIWDRSIQGRVKTILTVPNPQYHLTNLYGDLFNAYLGSPVASLARNLGISARALTYKARREAAAKTLGKRLDPKGGGVKIDGAKIGMDDLVKEAETHGAISQGFLARDLAEVLDAQGKTAAEKVGRGAYAKHFGKIGQKVASSRVGSRVLHPLDTVRDVSQYREDWVRLATYLGARKRGLAPDEAAKYVNRHHFDYGDLTQFERSVLRRVLPFYTFTARNTPLQVRTLFTRPGKYANLEKVREDAQNASKVPAGYEGDLQKYEQQGLPIPIPGTSNLLYPKLPATDLGRLTVKDQGNYLMAMLTPLIKTPVELNENYSFFLRKKIDELVDAKGPNGETVQTLKPAPPAVLAIVNRIPGPLRGEFTKALHLQPYIDKKTGKRVIGWPAKVDYVWRATPATNFASSAGAQIPNSRGQSPGQATFGYLSGLKVVPYSPPDVKTQNAQKSYAYLQAKAKSMRDTGSAYKHDGTRTPAYQKILDQARDAYKIISPPSPRPSFLSPEAQQALKEVRQQATGGSGFSADAQKALEDLRAGR